MNFKLTVQIVPLCYSELLLTNKVSSEHTIYNIYTVQCTAWNVNLMVIKLYGSSILFRQNTLIDF